MRETEVLVIGGGPAGLSAAVEAASHGCEVTLVDSDLALGGQLVKQTHKFFGSEAEHAGTRGFKIANILFDELEAAKDRITVMPNTTANGYYPDDGVIGLVKDEEEYIRLKANKIVVATGAMEKILPFPDNDTPGVYGAGAIQTLMNVYGVVPGQRVLMVGAGNIGLIVSYQLMQAGVEIAGIVEFMPRIGGYWVHAAKVRRMGVPIYLRHTIIDAIAENKVVAGAHIQQVNEKGQPTGEQIKVDCDTICMAVGLIPTAEILWQAGCDMKFVPELCGHVPQRNAYMQTTNPDFWVAGDASGIEEASAAMVEGRIAGVSVAKSLGRVRGEDFQGRYLEYWQRLASLRAGEVGQKIRCGIEKCSACGCSWDEEV
jgi:sarcosine oxidase subunit alpha